jgi:hypothetical protein
VEGGGQELLFFVGGQSKWLIAKNKVNKKKSWEHPPKSNKLKHEYILYYIYTNLLYNITFFQMWDQMGTTNYIGFFSSPFP